MAAGAVGNVGGREDGGGAVGRHVGAHQSEISGVTWPFEVIGVAAEVAKSQRGDVDDANVALEIDGVQVST